MTIILISLFGLTILGGLYLISYVLGNKNTPKGVALIHGSAGALAILVLLVASFFNHKLLYILIIFVLAAIGGILLFILDLFGKKIPKSLALAHGLIALTGFISLVIVLT